MDDMTYAVLDDEENESVSVPNHVPKFWIVLNELPPPPVLKRVAALADVPVTLLEELAAEGPVPIAGASTKLGAERKKAEMASTGASVSISTVKFPSLGVGLLLLSGLPSLVSLGLDVQAQQASEAYLIAVSLLFFISGLYFMVSEGMKQGHRIRKFRLLNNEQSEVSPAEQELQSVRKILLQSSLPTLLKEDLLSEVDSLDVPVHTQDDLELVRATCQELIHNVRELERQSTQDEQQHSLEEVQKRVREKSRRFAQHLKNKQ